MIIYAPMTSADAELFGEDGEMILGRERLSRSSAFVFLLFNCWLIRNEVRDRLRPRSRQFSPLRQFVSRRLATIDVL